MKFETQKEVGMKTLLTLTRPFLLLITNDLLCHFFHNKLRAKLEKQLLKRYKHANQKIFDPYSYKARRK